jgi:arsenite-transporting ATPase
MANPQLKETTSVLMFSGKGGVGKTTCSAATALHHAFMGSRTLAISTDATPSLSHIFEVEGGSKPTPVNEHLCLNELGMEEIREMWDRKFGREVHEVFSSLVDIGYEEFVEFMTSVLPGLGDEFMVDYIRELAQTGEYDTIVWDTAPLGQTLALLETPGLLADHLRMAPRIYSKLRLGPRSREPILDILRRWARMSEENMDFLRSRVEFTMVTIPEALAVEQLEGVFSEMGRYGIQAQHLIVNNVVRSDGSEFLRSKAAQQKHYLEHIHSTYSRMRILELPAFPYGIKGTDRLSEILQVLHQ